MKALSVKQPWAWLICKGYKDIENRNWRIGRKKAPYYNADYHLELPMRIYIHASKSHDEICNDTFDFIRKARGNPYGDGLEWRGDFGAIIGEVDIVDCVTESKSPWFVGKYGFVLANPILYEKPIPCRGMVGFFNPGIEMK